jgi:hypothetical protein
LTSYGQEVNIRRDVRVLAQSLLVEALEAGEKH